MRRILKRLVLAMVVMAMTVSMARSPVSAAEPGASAKADGGSPVKLKTAYSSDNDDDAAAVKYWTRQRLLKADGGSSLQAEANPIRAWNPLIGKIFFPTLRYSIAGCTGSVVGWNLIITAAHCFKYHGSGTAVFVPKYSNGNTPYGVWEIKHVWVDTRARGQRERFDYALVTLKRKSGQTLHQKTGIGAYQVSADAFYPNEQADLVGYPYVKHVPYECKGPVNTAYFRSVGYWDVHCGSGFDDGVSGTGWVHYESSWKTWTIGAVLGGYHEGGYGSATFASKWDSRIYSLWQAANKDSFK